MLWEVPHPFDKFSSLAGEVSLPERKELSCNFLLLSTFLLSVVVVSLPSKKDQSNRNPWYRWTNFYCLHFLLIDRRCCWGLSFVLFDRGVVLSVNKRTGNETNRRRTDVHWVTDEGILHSGGFRHAGRRFYWNIGIAITGGVTFEKGQILEKRTNYI